MITKALSIRAPWWWYILYAGKDIENRDWPTRFRGTIYVHASKWFNLEEVSSDANDAGDLYRLSGSTIGRDNGMTFREMRGLGGCIVGTVDIVDCVSGSDSPWFFGDYGFVLANPLAFAAPVACKGALGLFTVPDDVRALCEAQR